jgi:hypothetical protein
MRCGTRSLSLVSLGFGLVATGALSLAVATDYWLFTVEPLVPDSSTNGTGGPDTEDGSSSAVALIEQSEIADPTPERGKDSGISQKQQSEAVQQTTSASGLQTATEITVRVHSGLWRLCVVNEEPGILKFHSLILLI